MDMIMDIYVVAVLINELKDIIHEVKGMMMIFQQMNSNHMVKLNINILKVKIMYFKKAK